MSCNYFIKINEIMFLLMLHIDISFVNNSYHMKKSKY